MSLTKQKKKFFIYLIIYFFLFLFLILPLWLNKKFGSLYLEQFIFNLKLIYYGYLDGDSNLVNSAIKWLLIIPLIFSIILILIINFIHFIIENEDNSIEILIEKLKKIKKNFRNYNLFLAFRFFGTYFIKYLIFILIFLIIIFFYLFTNFFKEPDTVKNLDFFDQNYEYPVVSQNEDKYNLVVVYVESLEETFSNTKIFGENLLKDISNKNNSKKVKYFYQIPGTGYTLSSLVSSQCGIPLLQYKDSFSDIINLRGINKLLPNLTCLSDLLYQNSYENIFISSDNLSNSLTDKFLLSHHYTKLLGLNELKELGYQTSKKAYHYKKNWTGGIHDNILFEASLDILKEQKNKKNNFFLTIMTLDTHAPAGYPNVECLKKTIKDRNLNNFTISDSVKCTSKYLNEFINNLNKLDLENTFLVIVGDHLLMQDLNSNDRYIYNNFFVKDELKIMRDYMNHYDLFPSLLEAMNFRIHNRHGKVGLGYSIFVDNPDYKKISFLMKGSSKLYDKFWGLNED